MASELTDVQVVARYGFVEKRRSSRGRIETWYKHPAERGANYTFWRALLAAREAENLGMLPDGS
jgi:hypothetical protein